MNAFKGKGERLEGEIFEEREAFPPQPEKKASLEMKMA